MSKETKVNKQEKKILKHLYKVIRIQNDDRLAKKQRFANDIRAKAKQGHIFICAKIRDCDGLTDYTKTRLPAIPTVVQRHIDNYQEWADGFTSYTIIG